ncbi:MAG: hypothetical protein ABJG41_07985 [Cyclobacteriaceae bacterium]
MRIVLFVFVFLTFSLAHAQFDDELDYTREFTWGVNKNTNSGLIGGFAFKLALQKDPGLFHTFGLEILNVAHPKEQKYYSSQSGTTYIWGKANYLYSFRFLYGREKILYKKAPQQGVQISSLFALGPTLGIVAPHYLLRAADGKYVKYNIRDFPSRSAVGGSGKIFQGLGESKQELGFSAKAGLSFEFGAFKNSVAGLEAGVATEAFTKKIPIMLNSDNKAVYNSLYFTLYWGKRR